MPHEDFDIAELAEYLHLPASQVARLAERGKLPGRRLGGQWRFARAEVSHWLEQRIEGADAGELEAMESALDHARQSQRQEIDLAELLPLEAIAAPLAARTRSSVIREMCELAAATGLLWDAAKMADAVSAREALAPTALDSGVALLHPRRPLASLLGQAVIAVGVVGGGLPFGGAGGRLTDIFFLLAATSDHEYLRILARMSRIVGDPEWLAAVRAAPDAAAIRQLLLDRDRQLGVHAP